MSLWGRRPSEEPSGSRPSPLSWRKRRVAPDYEQERKDIQGLLLHGYKRMEVARFLLLGISEARGCRAWLRELLPELTSSADKSPEVLDQESSCANVAFTWPGLQALGLEPEALKTFPFEFRQGMAERAHLLGDSGDSHPERWEFGGQGSQGVPQERIHVMLMLYATDEDAMKEVLARHRDRLAAAGLVELYCQPAAHMKEKVTVQGKEHVFFKEHFGFRDSLSQPRIAGFRDPDVGAADYDRPIAAGEFILGYENEYGEKPMSPRIPAAKGDTDLGHNGTYLVLRKLHQDVAAFEAFVKEHQDLAARYTSEPEKQRTWLKAKLIGRWPNGAYLRPGEHEQPQCPHMDAHGIANDFNFRSDKEGFGCPLTSHVRRANPRDSLPPDRKLSMKLSRRHRILRRGIPYERAGEQGLLFIALNANLGRQFEFVQESWMNNEKAGGLYDERDPVTSNQDSGRLTLSAQPLRQSVRGLTRFVTVKGGGYFFLPGLAALRRLAAPAGTLEPEQAAT
ncbi:Dyp-type peroxidase [Hyalangium rubrum]|uniref:Dyp-type peroxidase n=1 Tax=Hyalangium rubrum TaxID=3103134 RepID=A0ABU5HDD8_9BACT|nr:Dyp-type peroxidase [Hyalangium sp. s54d21]MDY7231486.1 Dyp-type peroxidase [Hyalangium sp. s54d21]